MKRCLVIFRCDRLVLRLVDVHKSVSVTTIFQTKHRFHKIMQSEFQKLFIKGSPNINFIAGAQQYKGVYTSFIRYVRNI